MSAEISDNFAGDDFFGYNNLSSLTCFDFLINICEYLPINDIMVMRQVCKQWYKDCKEKLKVCAVGLNADGWYQWSNEETKVMGWGMRLLIDHVGNIKGMNKNSHNYSQIKIYSGTFQESQFNVNVKFPYTDQENSYKGRIDDGVFRGKSTIIVSLGSRKPGQTATIEGKVKWL
jgi:hypothetical protein